MLLAFLIKVDYIYEHFVPTVPLEKEEDKWKTLVIKAWLGGEKRAIAVEAHVSLLVPHQNRLWLNLYFVRY